MDDKKVVFDGIKDTGEDTDRQKELDYYVNLFRVAIRAQMALTKEYMVYTAEMTEAKTEPKRKLYKRKASKVKHEFTEVAEKVEALAAMLDAKGIDVESIVDQMIEEHGQEQEAEAAESDNEKDAE